MGNARSNSVNDPQYVFWPPNGAEQHVLLAQMILLGEHRKKGDINYLAIVRNTSFIIVKHM